MRPRVQQPKIKVEVHRGTADTGPWIAVTKDPGVYGRHRQMLGHRLAALAEQYLLGYPNCHAPVVLEDVLGITRVRVEVDSTDEALAALAAEEALDALAAAIRSNPGAVL